MNVEIPPSEPYVDQRCTTVRSRKKDRQERQRRRNKVTLLFLLLLLFLVVAFGLYLASQGVHRHRGPLRGIEESSHLG